MYIAKRTIKSLGQVYTAGSAITDPAVIKHFKTRVSAGDILVVTEHNYEACKAYFKAKHGVDIPAFVAADEDIKSNVPKTVSKTVTKPATAKAESTTAKAVTATATTK